MRCLVVRDAPRVPALAEERALSCSEPFLPGWRWRNAPFEPALRVLIEPARSSLLPDVWDPRQDPAAGLSRALGVALRLALPAEDEAWVALFRAGHLERSIALRGDRAERFHHGELSQATATEDRMEAWERGLTWLIGEPLDLEPEERWELPEVLTQLGS